MKIRIFWNLAGMILSDSGQLSSLAFPFKVYSKASDIERLFTRNLKFSVGSHDLDKLKEGAVFYFETDLAQQLGSHLNEGFIHYLLQSVRNHLAALWLIQDNAVDVSEMFFEIITGSQAEVGKLNANNMKVNCQGKKENVTLDVKKLSQAFKLYEKQIEPLCYISKPLHLGVSFSKFEEGNFQRAISQEGIGRFARFWQFILLARSSGDLGIKMTHNCIALEALFGNSSEGVTQQISERAACFLSDRRKTRKAISFHIREAYDTRSRVVHGSPLNSDRISTLAEMCSKMDQYLREIAKKYIEDSILQEIYADENRLNAYFESLLLN